MSNPLGRLINARIESPAPKYSFVALLLLLTFPYLDFVHIPTAGIDNSWRIALELIHQKNLTWGQDIIFTYGPLGRWLQRYVIVTNPVELLLVDTFFALNVACLLYSFLPNPLKGWHLVVFFLIWAIVNSMWGEWIHFTWFYIVIYWGIRSIYQPSPNLGLLCYLAVVCAINFFMKVNFGLIAIGFMISLVSYLYLSKGLNPRQSAAILGLLGLLLVLGATWLHTDLIRYTISSFYVIDGYNESQAIYPENRMRLVLLSYGSYLLQFLTAVIYLIKQLALPPKPGKEKFRTIFVLFWLLLLSFVLLKYAFTRADEGHLTAFVKQSSLLLLLVVICVQEEWLRKTFFVYLLLNCCFYLLFYAPIFGKIPVNYAALFSRQLQLVAHYFQMAATETYPDPQPTIRASIRQKIGQQTVDVIPNGISDIYLNRLNYNPRPTLQSYQSYNGYLDRKNREKYMSKTAPDWILYKYESIDGKYPLADETQTLLAVLQRYRVADQTSRQLFLKKNRDTKSLQLVKQATVQVRLGEKLALPGPDSLLHVLYVKTTYTVYGKLLHVFFQPPQLSMTLEAENNTSVSYRVVPALLEKGMLVNARVDNLADAREFLSTQQVSHKRLKHITFHQKVRWQAGFDPSIEVMIQSYQLK
ncbi:hypothetical protein GCM10028803_14620 [Larkinella knui]